MRNKLALSFAVLTVPSIALAHHGNDDSLPGQLLHASFDPLHLGLAALVVLGLVGLVRLAARRGRAS